MNIYIIRYNSPCSLRVSVGGLYKLYNCSVRLYNVLRNYNRNYIIDLDYYKPNISHILRLPKRYIIELNIYIMGYESSSGQCLEALYRIYYRIILVIYKLVGSAFLNQNVYYW